MAKKTGRRAHMKRWSATFINKSGPNPVAMAEYKSRAKSLFDPFIDAMFPAPKEGQVIHGNSTIDGHTGEVYIEPSYVKVGKNHLTNELREQIKKKIETLQNDVAREFATKIICIPNKREVFMFTAVRTVSSTEGFRSRVKTQTVHLVETDYRLGMVRKSITYGDKVRATNALRKGEVVWIEKVFLNQLLTAD